MVTRLFKNFAVWCDAARRAGLSATAELLVTRTASALFVVVVCPTVGVSVCDKPAQ